MEADEDLEGWGVALEPTIEEQEEEEAALISASITDDQLRALTGSHQLDTVDFLQMAVDSSCVPLDTLGERLPRLEQLKLNGSSLPSIRELGTSLNHLRVLWLCRCGLAELDGMSALPELQELYLAFNDIEKLDALAPLDQLQVLDLEANVVSDMTQVEWLQFLPAMQELTLRGNPVAEALTYRALTVGLLPNLALLDDEDRTVLDAPEDGLEASPLSPPRCTPQAEGLAAGSGADAERRGGAEAASPLASPSRSVGMSEEETEARRRRQAEERLVSHAIKYAEVGRVFDVSFDGRAFLGGSGEGAAARPAAAEYDHETYGDAEFYNQLLKEFLESKQLDAGNLTAGRGPKRRKVVDRRASKGRKLRYNVHEKLVNFMVPVPHERTSAAVDQLFSGLFGGNAR